MKPILSLACAAFLFATPAMAQDKLPVVASFSIIADMVRQVGGEHVEVTSLIGPNQDAHSFEPAPADSARLAGARAIFVNGLGFEGWIDRLIKASSSKADVFILSDNVPLLAAAGHDHGHDHDHDEEAQAYDPHAWQLASNGAIYVRNIQMGLCKVDAENCAEYEARASQYSAQLLALDDEIKARFTVIPKQDKRIIISHDAFAYFCEAHELDCLAARGITQDSEPSAKDIARLIQEIKKQKVRGLFIENVSDPRLLQQIGRETGLSPTLKLYSDALSDKDEPVPDYVSLLTYNANAIAGALEAK